MILNSLEVVFWAAVVFMMIQANLKFCQGTSCVLSWVVCVLGGVLRYVFHFLGCWFCEGGRVEGWERGLGKRRRLTDGVNSVVAAWTAVVSILDWRYHKATGMQRGVMVEMKNEFKHVELGEAPSYQK